MEYNIKLLNTVLCITVTLLLLPSVAASFVQAGGSCLYDGYKDISTEQDICIESSNGINKALGANFSFDEPASGSLYINGKLAIVFEGKYSVGGNQTLKPGKNTLKIRVESPVWLTRIWGYNGVTFCGFYSSDPLERVKKSINSLSIEQKKELLQWLKKDIEK